MAKQAENDTGDPSYANATVATLLNIFLFNLNTFKLG